jgi:D-aspartate ligase
MFRLCVVPAPSKFSDTGAVVAGGDYQGLGIVRSLGRRGVPVYVVDDEPSIARFSRYKTRALRIPDLRDDSRIAESFLRMGRRYGLDGWVLYPTRDEIVAAFSHHRAELASVFRVATPAWSTVRIAWDKRLTYELAGSLGIPTPQTWYAQNVADLATRDVSLPLALKPAIKEHFIYATKVKAVRADTREQLEASFRQICTVIPPDEVMLQDLIPGGGERQFSYCSFFKEGRPIAKMVVRRTRQRPPDFGRSSTYVETVDIPELEQPSERFLTAIDYYGLSELEYKYDERDGSYKLLDVNLRTWGYHSLGRPAGVDFPFLLFCDQLEREVEPSRARTGVRWIRLTTDLPTALQEIWRGRLGWRPFLDSIRTFETEAVFERDDLLPALAEVALLPYLYRTRGSGGWKTT